MIHQVVNEGKIVLVVLSVVARMYRANIPERNDQWLWFPECLNSGSANHVNFWQDN